MAGTIFGLPLSQRVDINGSPLVGGLLYIFLANTTTPVTAYKNFGLTAGQEQPHPMVLDGTGTIPEFWLADGDYRARLTDSLGVVIYDLLNVKALGPSSGGGGGGDTTDPNSIMSTMDFKWRPTSGTLAGWVRANGRTIGSVTSGASERANADTQVLFELLWNTFSDTICPVSGGRGTSSAVDWAANKTIGLLDLRGRAPFGLDDMGNSAAGRLAGATFAQGTATSAAASGGEGTHALTTGETPSHTHAFSGTTSTDGAHTHTIGRTNGNNDASGVGPTPEPPNAAYTTSSDGAHAHTFSGTTAATGSGASHNNMSPFMLGSWFIRL